MYVYTLVFDGDDLWYWQLLINTWAVTVNTHDRCVNVAFCCAKCIWGLPSVAFKRGEKNKRINCLIGLNDLYWKHNNAAFLCGQRQCSCFRWFDFAHCKIGLKTQCFPTCVRLVVAPTEVYTENLYNVARREPVQSRNEPSPRTRANSTGEHGGWACCDIWKTSGPRPWRCCLEVSSLRTLESTICRDELKPLKAQRWTLLIAT